MERYSNNTQIKSNHKLGNSLLVLIIITALAGLLYSFMGSENHSTDYEGTVLPMKINQKPGEGQDQKTNKLARNINQKSNEYLTIDGIMETGMPISFQVHPFHNNAIYYLDLGNGSMYKMDNDTHTYTFKNAGKFEIKLQVEYKGSLRTIQQEEIQINPAFELAGH